MTGPLAGYDWTSDGLLAPVRYIDAGDKQRGLICNGCGPAGWKFDLVPDTIWGLSVTQACDIHDWGYHEGRTDLDKQTADLVLLVNLIILCLRGRRWLLPLRAYRATSYYLAVARPGGAAFSAGKESADAAPGTEVPRDLGVG